MTTTALATLGEQGLMERMQQARWTQSLSVQDRKDLARLAIEMNLDPTMGEITIYEGKPYVTLSGYIRTAHNTNMFEGVEDRPMTQEERELYGITQPVGWIAKVYRRNFRVPSTGTGSADPDKPHRNNPIEKAKPQWMARSRAIRQALKLAFPNETPFARITAVGSADDLGIDPETGEILGTHAEPVQIHVVEPFEAGDFTEDDAPADLIAIETPEPQDEAAAKEDLRMKIMAIASRRSLTPAQVEKWCQKHHGKSFDDENVDGLIALAEALQAQKAG